MTKTTTSSLAAALDVFVRNVKYRMAVLGVETKVGLWEMAKRKSATAPSEPKTINNILNKRHDAKLSTFNSIAEGLDVPLWVLFVPGLKEGDLRSPHKERLVSLVENYLACEADSEGRAHTESMAAAFAAKARAKAE